MQPSKELDKFLSQMEASGDITAIRDICKMFDLNIGNVLKYKDALWSVIPSSDGGKEGATFNQTRWCSLPFMGWKEDQQKS